MEVIYTGWHPWKEFFSGCGRLSGGIAKLCLLAGLMGWGTTALAQGQTPLAAQPQDSLAQLRGTVRDSSNRGLAGAKLVVKGRDVAVTTDSYGGFKLLLPRGNYTLSISSPGYPTYDFPIDQEDFSAFYWEFSMLSGKKHRGQLVGSTMGQGPAKREILKTVQVYFATDRTLGKKTGQIQAFTNGRSGMHYGTAMVTIPGTHVVGEIEQSLFDKTNPYKNVLLKSTNLLAQDVFFTQLATKVKNSQKSAAFVFIHGYNVTFADAALRTAQMHYDLKFPGVPAFFSWPSQGALAKYVVDEQNAEWAQEDFKGFLRDFLMRTSAQQVYLIAHSMGSRPVMRAVRELLVEHPELAPRIQEIILAAPDFDAEVFKRSVAPVLQKNHIRTTLYASSQDRALFVSSKVHGAYSRLGLVGSSGPYTMKGMETIVASDAEPRSFGLSFGLGHSYFGDVPLVLTDLRALMVNGVLPANRSSLIKVPVVNGQHYWKLTKEAW